MTPFALCLARVLRRLRTKQRLVSLDFVYNTFMEPIKMHVLYKVTPSHEHSFLIFTELSSDSKPELVFFSAEKTNIFNFGSLNNRYVW